MNNPLLVIGNRNYSSWSLRPWILAQHIGIRLETERLVLDTPEFRARALHYTPTGRVPVLVHDGVSIPESIAIFEYLNELADGRAWPEDRRQRARARALVAEMHAGFAALRQAYPMNLRARDRRVLLTDPLAADIRRIDAIFSREPAQDGPWLFGRYTAADAMFLPVALRFMTYGEHGLSARACVYVATAIGDPMLAPWMQAALGETEVIAHEEVGQ